MTEKYSSLCKQLASMVEYEKHWVPNLANASSLLWQNLEGLNWAGFYTMEKEGYLLLGPFQGKPACIRIAPGKGVCGTAAAEDKTQLVADVHQFKGHIACDSASNSEIVIPLHNQEGKVAGVMDIDSPELNHFTLEDKEGLEAFAKILETSCLWD